MRRAARTDWLPPALLGAAVAAAYANALGASFQFDDWNVVVADARVQSLHAWWASMPGMRPLLKLSYAWNHASGLSVAGFHAVNVAIHALCACLVYRLLSIRAGHRRAVALGAAALFALHPVQTEAVTYVCGRSTSLCATLALASLLAWVEGRRRAHATLVHVAAPLLFIAALAVKETAVVVPLAMLLWWATDPDRSSVGDALRSILVPCVVIVVAGAVALASPIYRRLLETSFDTRGIGSNLITQANAIAYLGGQLVRIDRLNADPALPVLDGWTPGAALAAGVIVTLVLGAFALLRRFPETSFGILWFFLWLLPTNSLVPRLDVANDRQLYVASIGPAWLVARSILSSRRAGRVAGMVGLCGLLALATARRNLVYRDEIVFWEDALRKAPHNERAWNNLGYAYALVGRDAEAETAFEYALVLDPEAMRAAVNLKLLRRGELRPRPTPSAPDPRSPPRRSRSPGSPG